MDEKFYNLNGVEPPTRTIHELSGNDLSQKVKPLSMTNWRQEGNRLIADTEMGQVVNIIPTNCLFAGVDESGKPKLTKIHP